MHTHTQHTQHTHIHQTPHTTHTSHMRVHIHSVECTPPTGEPPQGSVHSAWNPQWGVESPQWWVFIGEWTLPSGDSSLGRALPPGDFALGHGHSPVWSVHPPLGSLPRGVYIPRLGIPSGEWRVPSGGFSWSGHSPVGTPHWGVSTSLWGLCTGAGHSPVGSPHWGLDTPQ